MSQQIWHAFYYESAGAMSPCRSEVIEAANEEDAVREARAHLGPCVRVSLEAASWTERRNRLIVAAPVERRGPLH